MILFGILFRRGWKGETMQDLNLKVLDNDELRKVQEATVEILEKVGIWVDHEEARQLLKESGAIVEEGSEVVRIPREMLEKALSRCLPVVELYGRDGSLPLQVGEGNVYFGTQGFPTYMLDWRNGGYRLATKTDLAGNSTIG